MGSFRRNRTEIAKDNEPVHYEPSKVTFSLFSSKEILKLSACQITSPVAFNNLAHPISGGLYDLRMGPFSDRQGLFCSTCILHVEYCPGHLGHIELPLPVCNPLFYSVILRLLKMSCITCHRFRVPDFQKRLFLSQQQLLNMGLITAAQDATQIASVTPSVYDDDEEKKSAKRERALFENTEMIRKLDAFVEEQLEEYERKGESIAKEKSTRNIESLRQQYNKQFLAEQTKSGTCTNCGAVTKKIVFYKSRFIYEGAVKENEDGDESLNLSFVKKSRRSRQMGASEKTELNPEEIKAHFRELWLYDADLLAYLFPMLRKNDCEHPTDMFFVDILPVPPPKTRPCQYTGGIMTLHPQSQALQQVIEAVTMMKQVLQVIRGADIESLSQEAKDLLKVLRGDTPEIQLGTVWKELQAAVDHVLDRELNRSGSAKNSGWGFKQLIERKQGIYRMHMMGKRVNFAARTVITPDPNINIDEVGLPEVFAKKLTYKVPVTPWNVEELREMVMNGPDVHPGAVYVESEDGNRKNIDPNNEVQREALAKTLLTKSTDTEDDGQTKFVYRHLKNGDAMLLNRQPTLHKPSILSHRARVLKGEKVMRLHYAVCKSFNADFDGDEMNAHFPQTEVARSEAYNIVNVCKQYLVPKDGTPLQGLIQDHVIAGVKMSMRGRFFDRSQYQQLVYGALVEHTGVIKTVPPAIQKPQQLWSGKQIITTLIINLVPQGKVAPTLHSTAKVKSSEFQRERPRPWGPGETPLPEKPSATETTMSESEVIFRQGEFVSGILDKNQFGSTPYSLVHAFFELYGGTYSGKLLSAFSKIFTIFLHTEGFTLGVHDIVVKKSGNEKRKQIMADTAKIGDECAAAGVGLKEYEDISELPAKLETFHRESRKIPRKRMEIDRAYKDRLAPANNDINAACCPKGLVKHFPDNNLQLMIQAGAKGGTVNAMQISSLLGQIELEGKRPPIMISGKSLPSFKPYDTQPRAGGFIAGRFMSGIRPQEFFFHCMAGREGLIDTAVKTSRSGYLQRCLIKLLEGLFVNYDLTVRDSDGSVVQFRYGEDSLDTCKSQYLNPKQLDFLNDNIDIVLDQTAVQMAQKNTKTEGVAKLKKQIKKHQKKHSSVSGRTSAFLRFCQKYSSTADGLSTQVEKTTGRSPATHGLVNGWYDMPVDQKEPFIKKARSCPDPLVYKYRPDSNFSSVTELVDRMIDDYVDKKFRPTVEDQKKRKAFEDMIYLKCMNAMVDAGEPVGVLAAQSVGEPSTQMTLNTFHFAGRGDMNVTLGIPRLREILMVASANIKTPSLTIPFLPDVSDKEKDKLRIQLNRVTLADVLESAHVRERVRLTGQRTRLIAIKFQFLQRKMYKDKYKVTPADILRYFERKFVSKVFMPVLSSIIKDKKIVVESGTEKEKKKKRGGGDEEDEDDPGEAADREMEASERRGVGEEHASSDEEDLPDDADATETRKRNRQQDEDYEEGLSEEEEDMVRKLDRKLDDESDLFPEEDANQSRPSTPASSDYGSGEEDEEEEEYDDGMNTVEAQKRQAFVLNVCQGKTGAANIVEYTFDAKKEQWCEITLGFNVERKTLDMSNVIRKAAERGVIHEVKDIKRAILAKNEKQEVVLTTEGVNIEAMFNYDQKLDLNRLQCNNVHDVARYYGIEAANRTIVREIVNVFSVYGIVVNPRHLSVIADYMTFDGTYKPFNRIGIENNPSPLQQMTFETATGFLRSAALGGKSDSLDSPSSCLVLGKPCQGGTGLFKLVQNLKI